MSARAGWYHAGQRRSRAPVIRRPPRGRHWAATEPPRGRPHRPSWFDLGETRGAPVGRMCSMRIVARLRSFIRPAFLAGALLLLAAPAALAQTPKLTDHVTDQTGTLGSGKAAVEDSLANLLDRANVELWVVLVSTTDGGT